MTMLDMPQGLWYKILVNGQSCHGGDLEWSLPTAQPDGSWTPGDWHEVDGEIDCCVNGLHLTRTPFCWWLNGSKVYEVEWAGEWSTDEDEDSDKIAVRRCRLLREVEWADHQVFSAGKHEVREGRAIALGSADVVARGSSHVEAWGSSHVVARESSHVVARESSHVVAWESSHVEAWGSSHVVARGSSHVEAADAANVVRTRWHSSDDDAVQLAGEAACIDRRGGGVRCYTADGLSPIAERGQ